MDIKYYDLLSTAIIGIVIVAVVNYLFLGNMEIDGIVILALGYWVGYFINAIGSLFERFYFITTGGKPSDKFLTSIEGQEWTGCNQIRFYEVDKVIEMLKKDLNDPNASVGKMFGYAMRKVSCCKESRVLAFNAQYAWSRTLFTTTWIAVIVFAFRYYDEWLFWLTCAILLFISWNRFKERGLYFAREVLNEYLRQEESRLSLI